MDCKSITTIPPSILCCCSVAKSCPTLCGSINTKSDQLSSWTHHHWLLLPLFYTLTLPSPSKSFHFFLCSTLFSIFQGQRCYYTKLDQVTIALCCLTASSLFPINPVVVVLVTQSCPTLCNTMDYSAPGSSVHGIFQARILEWVAFPFPGDLADPGIKPESPALQADFFFFNHLSHKGSQPNLSYIPSLSYFLKMPCFHHVSSVHKNQQGLVIAHNLQCGVQELFSIWLCSHPYSITPHHSLWGNGLPPIVC